MSRSDLALAGAAEGPIPGHPVETPPVVDNVLGCLYGPGDGKAFQGVTGKDLINPIPRATS